MSSSYGAWEPVIGLEVHAQLLTKTKLFCGCRTSFGDPPNTHVCPVCLGLPGALPTLNARAVELAVRGALALSCRIVERSVFARKSYFYPDLPKGYQISQYELPFARDGRIPLDETGERIARIQRIHMEEDAGKSIHAAGSSIVDLNRAGTPLVEIVSEPDLRSASEASFYLRTLRDVLMFAGVNDGNLERGNFRCDANVSVRKKGDERLGVRAELKNINSFRFVEDAIDVEVRRQIAELEAGRTFPMATRGYNSDTKTTFLMREKEGDAGYRYFPDPDLPPLELEATYVQTVKSALPELPAARRARYASELGLTPYAASVLTGHPAVATFFEETVRLGADAVKAANFIQTEVLKGANLHGVDAKLGVSPAQVAGLLALVNRGTISGKQAKEVFAKMAGTADTAEAIVERDGMAMMSDTGALEALAEKIVAANARQAESYRAGKKQLMGFFVGQLMKETKGSANPALVTGIFEKLLAPKEAS